MQYKKEERKKSDGGITNNIEKWSRYWETNT